MAFRRVVAAIQTEGQRPTGPKLSALVTQAVGPIRSRRRTVGSGRSRARCKEKREGDMEAFRRALLLLRGDKRDLVLIAFEQFLKARLFKTRTGLSRALEAMSAALVSWEGARTMEDHEAMEAIFDMINRARPLRQEIVYRRQVVQRNQELGDRKAKISRTKFLEAFHRHEASVGNDALIASAIAREFHDSRENVGRRIRRYRAHGVLPMRLVRKT
jgi:hypothetical protein